MNMFPPLLVVMMGTSGAALAVDYMVDFTRIEDFETVRPVIEHCGDFGAMELYRERMSSTADLNEMREVFERTGFGMFNDCTEGIKGVGIEPVK